MATIISTCSTLYEILVTEQNAMAAGIFTYSNVCGISTQMKSADQGSIYLHLQYLSWDWVHWEREEIVDATF